MTKELDNVRDAALVLMQPINRLLTEIQSMEARSQALIQMILKMAAHINPDWETNARLSEMLENGKVPSFSHTPGEPVRVMRKTVGGKGYVKMESLVDFLKNVQSEKPTAL